MKTERHKFTKDEVKRLMKCYKVKTPEEALENWAYREFDLKHNASLMIGKQGKTFIEIKEMD